MSYKPSTDPKWVDWYNKATKNLTDLGYQKVKTCPCAANLELWELSPDKTVDGVGIVTGGQKPPDGVGGMALNYHITLPDPVNFKGVTEDNIDTTENGWHSLPRQTRFS